MTYKFFKIMVVASLLVAPMACQKENEAVTPQTPPVVHSAE
ncbi:hypothetical protein [Runella sp. SP2]|nr:hypothetical protein [Runella sp. SP2]